LIGTTVKPATWAFRLQNETIFLLTVSRREDKMRAYQGSGTRWFPGPIGRILAATEES
jgi:hypothetical protein